MENDPKLFLNRELSWLAFNDRVLEEAKNPAVPLFERIKFLSIVASNLDEFFMIRVAGLKQQVSSGVVGTGVDGMLPVEQLTVISERAHTTVDEQYRVWLTDIMPQLRAQSICILSPKELSAPQKAAADEYFLKSVLPILTPLAVDPVHPFPHLRNKTMNIAVLLSRLDKRRRKKDTQEHSLAVVQVPSVLPRLVPLPATDGKAYTLLGELIAEHAGELFMGYTVKQTARFRVTRNWDISVDEEESEDLLSTIQEELRRRDRGQAVRLEIEVNASKEIESMLTAALQLSTPDVYRVAGPLQLSDFTAIADADPRPELRVEALAPAIPAQLRDAESIFPVIAAHDLLLHHPYESFDPVVRMVEEAADDPNVLAIKQTLYRTSGDSPIARALSRAAENGKQVAVLIEIKARMDEANNILWARRLEEHGVHVVYGLMGLKTHAKVLMVVRKEANGLKRYVHLGTGNYNPQTARTYTDFSFFTCRPEFADDVTAFFNLLTGYADAPKWKRLVVAPIGLQDKVIELIDRETARAKKGEPARIIAKMNSLVEPTVIRALYTASQAGVSIDLLVRGICCLRPGIPGVSENIRVTSIIDRFLEHSRMFAFGSPERVEVWLSSADWMPRNFHRRIEVLFPIEDPVLRARIVDEVLGTTLRDNVKSRRLQPDGSYQLVGVSENDHEVRSQQVFMELARRGPALAQPAIRHVAAPELPNLPNLAVRLSSGTA